MSVKLGILTPSISRRAGGLFQSVPGIAHGLNRNGKGEVVVFGLEDEYTQQDRERWNGLPVKVMSQRGPALFGFAPDLSSELRAGGLDLLHVHGIWMYPSVACRRWANRESKPYVVSPRGMLDAWALQNAAWKKHLAGWLYENEHLRGAACLHALNSAEAEAMRAYGLRNPICVIPNGVEMPEKAQRPAGWSSQVPEGAKVLLFLGRLHPKKGLVNLLRAWAEARRTPGAEDWCLVIAGWDQGGQRAELERLCHELGARDVVRFVGPQYGDAKAGSFVRADAFVLPSFSEGLPIAVLEAWSYGLPVAMTPQCNLPEGFDAQAALRVAPHVEGITQGLQDLFAMTDDERYAMGARGRRLVEQKFSWPVIADEMRKVYEWVQGGGERPSCILM